MFKLCPLPAQGISRYSPDVMKNYSRIAMPIAFLAMLEEKEGTQNLQEVWEEIWQDGTPGNEGGIRLYTVHSEYYEVWNLESGPPAQDSEVWTVECEGSGSQSYEYSVY